MRRRFVRSSSLELSAHGPRLAGCIIATSDFRFSVHTTRLRLARRGKMATLNGLIGSIRRECLEHIVIVSEASLRRTLKAYARYYNEVRTQRSLHKDAPEVRPIHFIGAVRSQLILGGLHHHYVRV
jgi:hypothetical protein